LFLDQSYACDLVALAVVGQASKAQRIGPWIVRQSTAKSRSLAVRGGGLTLKSNPMLLINRLGKS
jgi:hypothetical protein